MNQQELIQKYESEIADAKDKIVKMQQQKDDFANKNWLLQSEIESKEQQIKTLQNQQVPIPIVQKKKSNAGWVVFFVLLSIGLGITAIVFYSEMESYSSSYDSERNENYDLRQQVEELRSGNNETISNLRNEISQKEYTISSLQSQLPQSYKINVNSAAIYYKNCYNEFINFNCSYNYGAVVSVYAQQDGYGLTYHGWVYMSHME